ncbi:hypothetical protein IWW48_006377, partial [Coemansia sp. RSA 1200]
SCLKSAAEHKDSNRRRLWNRDTAGVLNFRHILHGLRKNKCIPEHFQRAQPKPPVVPKQKAKRKPKTIDSINLHASAQAFCSKQQR